MPGTNCSNCCFSTWSDQSQIGCSVNRLSKYPHVQVLNEEQNGIYYVLTENCCPSKRTKSWLSKNPRDPIGVVRRELKPKVQLIVIIDEVNEAWLNFFATLDLSQYSAVDVLIFEPQLTFMQTLGSLLTYNNLFIHACYKVENTLGTSEEYHINYNVRKDCDFYVLTDDPENARINDYPAKLDYYLNDLCKSLLMVASDSDSLYNNLVVYTPMHFSLGGYGSQIMEDKIIIYCTNNEREDLWLCQGEFWEVCSSGEAAYNVDEGTETDAATLA